MQGGTGDFRSAGVSVPCLRNSEHTAIIIAAKTPREKSPPDETDGWLTNPASEVTTGAAR
jgi:hypothetical protein